MRKNESFLFALIVSLFINNIQLGILHMRNVKRLEKIIEIVKILHPEDVNKIEELEK